MSRSSKRKQEIYNVAVRLFREKGYAAASMRDIAERVGIEASSLYSHIKSKDELLADICMHCSHMFEEGIQCILGEQGTFSQKLEALLKLHIDIALNHPSSVTVFNDEWKHLSQDKLSKFVESRRAYETRFRKLLREGMESGEFTQRSSKVVFNIIISSTKWLHHYPRTMTKEEQGKFEEEIISFIKSGLLK